MEQLEGIGLDAFIEKRGPLPQAQAVEIVLQACEGLAEAHAVALVHRDIKPANLFLARRPDGKFVLKILDFGISKRLLGNIGLGLTDPGSSLGSPWYMSPEQMKDSSMVDQRADVWSLGVLLFELLTKEWPFGGESLPQVCVSVLTADPPVPSALRPDIDAGLDAVVLRCLEKDPEKRYFDVAALAEDLRRFAPRSVRSSALELDEMGATHGAEGTKKSAGTFESLAPVFSRPRFLRSRWSSVTTAAGLFAAGVLLASIALPYAREQYRRSGWTELSRVRLPWDPELRPAPLEDQTTPRNDSRSPMLLQSITARVSSDTSTPTVVLGDARLVLGPTSAEIRRTTANFRAWQRENERLRPTEEKGSERLGAEETEEAPHDER
jgi:serine/threonine protein kinase